MHDPTEIRATVDAYIALRARIEDGEATWIDLADFFTDDAVYIDPAWGRIQGIDEIRAFLVDSMRGLEDWRFPMRFAAIEGDDVVTVWTQVLPGRARRRPAVPADRACRSSATRATGKFSYEEDLLNMAHVLEDLGASGWRPGAGFTAPPAEPRPHHGLTPCAPQGRRRLDMVVLGAGAVGGRSHRRRRRRWPATPSASPRCGSGPS